MSNLVRATGGVPTTSVICDLNDPSECKQIGDGGQGIVFATQGYKTRWVQCLKVMDPLECHAQIVNVRHILQTRPWLYSELAEVASVPQWLVYDAGPRVGSLPDSDAYIGFGSDVAAPVVGYTMQHLEGWSHLSDVMTPFGARELGVGRKETALIFIALHKALSLIHSKGFIVGDFNASNIMFRAVAGRYEVRIIDVDTWSINRPDIGCHHISSVVDPDDACHPENLYAISKGRSPVPQYSHDWWAFALHLYRALAKHDPFSEGIYLDFDRTDRIIGGITTLSLGVDLATQVQSEIQRIENRLLHALDRHLRVQRAGPFPLKLIAELYTGEWA